ncbi:MAG: 2,3,4,5-tetrahydropyridine-2,6-dicarboxylate N-succinyltransferase, partial [Bacteroidales bacterium]|nr:2,3,4,5-tetrahydropyridine-2,6-dicarboxylate N-succinyltransferase [Bacteroidales bacterium]
MLHQYKNIIESAWENRDLLKNPDVINTIKAIIDKLDNGLIRVADPCDGAWKVNEWIKKAVLL